MNDLAKLHEEKYQTALLNGQPGWGGVERIANLPKMVDERFLSFDKVPLSGHLLEIGCGAGNISMELAKRGYEVSGIDFSETAIAWARENATKSNLKIDFQVADATDLSVFGDNSFDIIFDGNCIHCLIGEKRDLAFREFRRILKPDGILFVSSLSAIELDPAFPIHFDSKSRVLLEADAPYRYIPTAESLAREITNSGFRVLKKHVRDGSPFGHTTIHAQKVVES